MNKNKKEPTKDFLVDKGLVLGTGKNLNKSN